MNIQTATAFVTGANRGFGRELVLALQARGVRKVYAAARDPKTIDIPGVVPVALDVTDSQAIARAAARCEDVNLLINNAGIAEFNGYLGPEAVTQMRRMFETNVFGPVNLARAFAPVLAANGGGAIVNILSVASWISSELLGPYAASKAAAWSFTNGLRIELAKQHTQVLGLHVGFMDTDMARDVPFAKSSPATVAAATIDGLAEGKLEVLGDDITRLVKQGLSAEAGIYLAPIER